MQIPIEAKNRKNLVEDNITKIQAQIINNDKSRVNIYIYLAKNECLNNKNKKKDKNNASIVEKRNLTMKQMKDQNNEVKKLETTRF